MVKEEDKAMDCGPMARNVILFFPFGNCVPKLTYQNFVRPASAKMTKIFNRKSEYRDFVKNDIF